MRRSGTLVQEPILILPNIKDMNFRQSLTELVGFSLLQFLTGNDERKIRHCSECKKFVIAGSVRIDTNRFCSNKCKSAFDNRNRIPGLNADLH